MVAAGRLDRMADWHSLSTAHVTVQRNFSISQIPVYVRAGAIIPEAPPMQYSNQKPLDPLIVNVFPLADGQISTYTLYEDAGDSRAYEHNADARTEIRATRGQRGVGGGYRGRERHLPRHANFPRIRDPAAWGLAAGIGHGERANAESNH